MKLMERINSIWESIRNLWKIAKPIICALETEEEEKTLLMFLDTYNVGSKLYYKRSNRSYKEVQDHIRNNEYAILDKIHNRLRKKYESSSINKKGSK